ncbi:hypothetical protein NN561_006551 [Cricetulus griseus]
MLLRLLSCACVQGFQAQESRILHCAREMEAFEEEAPTLGPPQPASLDEELFRKTRSGDMDSYDLTILHFNDVYDVDSHTEEPVGGAARCGPPSSLSDSEGGMEGSDWEPARKLGGWEVVFHANHLGHCLNSLLDEVSNSSGF